MITVKLYGLLRLESGMKEISVDASNVKDMLTSLERAGLDRNTLSGCNILVNSLPAGKRTKLKNGDTVQLFPPVAGG